METTETSQHIDEPKSQSLSQSSKASRKSNSSRKSQPPQDNAIDAASRNVSHEEQKTEASQRSSSQKSQKDPKSQQTEGSNPNQSPSQNPSEVNSKNSSRTTSSDSQATSEDVPATTNWWSVISSVATEVSNAVVAGVKEEIEEIKEDIQTVSAASVTAGQHIASYSTVAAEKAKEASIQATAAGKEFLNTDLTEFSRVLTEETNETVKDVKEVTSLIGGAFSGLVGNISNYVANSNLVSSNNYYEDYDQSGIIIGKNKQKLTFVSAFEARVHNLRTDTSTYCVEPDDESDYELWRETFDLDSPSTKTTISDLLVASQEVRSLYTKLVPSAVAHQIFWQRYFYKLDALERAERRRTALMERAGKSEEDDEEELSWGGDSEEDEASPRSSAKKEEKNPEEGQSKKEDSLQIVDKESELSGSPVVVDKEEKPAPAKGKNEGEDDDWEKEFDIDMTEEQIQAALNDDDDSDNLDDWD